MANDRKAYLAGGGIGSLAAAAFMIRDGGMAGANIHIFDAQTLAGGSLDAGGDAACGYSMRGGRMFTLDNYECTWALFKGIPSLSTPGLSVYDETVAFNDIHQTHAHARLVDRARCKVPVGSMAFSMADRMELLRLLDTSELELRDSRITDWFAPHFFQSSFWVMWSTTFAFLPWHSATELRRYLHRFMREFSRLGTLSGVKRTIYNQYDSLVRPLQKWLEEHGVTVHSNCVVAGLEHVYAEGRFVITGIECLQSGLARRYAVDPGDLVVIQNGSMTDDSSVGSQDTAPAKRAMSQTPGWRLWEELARDQPQFGRPDAFRKCIAQSCWESFTVTLQTPAFFNEMEKFTTDRPGSGALVTFKDSQWLLSVVLPHQPHFLNQPPDVQVFWGYGLYPDRVGNFVAKPMDACSGAEILQELCGHLRFDAETVQGANCIPCRMPYITSMFMPRRPGDRPLPVPVISKNMAFVSQFVELPEDVVFTVEYSVRAAQAAVYSLLGLGLQIPPITAHDKSVRTRLDAVVEAFA